MLKTEYLDLGRVWCINFSHKFILSDRELSLEYSISYLIIKTNNNAAYRVSTKHISTIFNEDSDNVGVTKPSCPQQRVHAVLQQNKQLGWAVQQNNVAKHTMMRSKKWEIMKINYWDVHEKSGHLLYYINITKIT